VCYGFPKYRWIVFVLLVFWTANTHDPVWLAAEGTSFGDAVPDGNVQEFLRRRIQMLRTRIAELDGQIGGLREKIAALQEEIEKLLREAEAIEVPQEVDEPETSPEDEPREVPFRPPLLRYVVKETPLVIVCRNGRAAILDLEEWARRERGVMAGAQQDKPSQETEEVRVPAGDFEVVLKISREDAGAPVVKEAQPKSDLVGEKFETALRPDSRLERRLRRADGQNSVVQFAVYPDSFEGFRLVRDLVWSQKFDVNWLPFEHGEPIRISSRTDGIGIQ
jgi:hypothetical protein